MPYSDQMNERRREDRGRREFEETVLSTLADLTAAVEKNSADVQALIAAVKAIPAGTLSAADQAAVDGAVAQLGTTDAAAEAAVTPPVVPPVA
jgi:putative exporter of polyketide antibiotics